MRGARRETRGARRENNNSNTNAGPHADVPLPREDGLSSSND